VYLISQCPSTLCLCPTPLPLNLSLLSLRVWETQLCVCIGGKDCNGSAKKRPTTQSALPHRAQLASVYIRFPSLLCWIWIYLHQQHCVLPRLFKLWNTRSCVGYESTLKHGLPEIDVYTHTLKQYFICIHIRWNTVLLFVGYKSTYISKTVFQRICVHVKNCFSVYVYTLNTACMSLSDIYTFIRNHVLWWICI